MTHALLGSLFVVATCGLVYELVAGALASYLLGDTVLQFSTVIGAYLFAMGLGAWLSKYVGRGLAARFVQIEILVGLIGGWSGALLFLAFTYAAGFRLVLYLLVLLIGTLVGMEIPLLMRLLKGRLEFKDLVSQVLTVDYLGALGASVLFPLVLVPRLGLLNTAFVFGLLNVAVAALALRLLRDEIPDSARLKAGCAAAAVLLAAGLAGSRAIADHAEGSLYADEVVFSKTSTYQRIVLTRWKDDWRLFLGGHLQFSTMDEYRYHESLVHPALSSHPAPRRVLILGGGDGLAAREVLRDPRVKEVTLVDLDPEMTRLFSTHPQLSRINGGSLQDPRVAVVNADAFKWLETSLGGFDAAIVDFPDPSNFAVGKLFSAPFYRLLKRRMAKGGVVSVQATSPLFARRSFWCIERTMADAGWKTAPYHAYVPSFGEWGFVIGKDGDAYRPPLRLPEGLRFLTTATLPSLFEFPSDMARVDADVNRLDTQALVRYYEAEWEKVVQ